MLMDNDGWWCRCCRKLFLSDQCFNIIAMGRFSVVPFAHHPTAPVSPGSFVWYHVGQSFSPENKTMDGTNVSVMYLWRASQPGGVPLQRDPHPELAGLKKPRAYENPLVSLKCQLLVTLISEEADWPVITSMDDSTWSFLIRKELSPWLWICGCERCEPKKF